MQIYENLSLENLPGEIWKRVPGFPKYKASSLGRVKSFVNYSPKILKQHPHRRGYVHITLFNKNGKRHFKTHQVIAITFVPNLENYKEVNHIDFNKLNNSFCNLEWCTRSHNMKHMISNYVQTHRNGYTNPKARHVLHVEVWYFLYCKRSGQNSWMLRIEHEHDAEGI